MHLVRPTSGGLADGGIVGELDIRQHDVPVFFASVDGYCKHTTLSVQPVVCGWYELVVIYIYPLAPSSPSTPSGRLCPTCRKSDCSTSFWSLTVNGLSGRTRHLLACLRIHKMRTLFSILCLLCVHLEPRATRNHRTTMTPILHVSTHRESHLQILSRACSSQDILSVNLHAEQPFVVHRHETGRV